MEDMKAMKAMKQHDIKKYKVFQRTFLAQAPHETQAFK